LESAIFGLIGVVVGALLTTVKDWWFEHRRSNKDLAYLATHVVCLFDRFVEGCIEVTRDDGLCYGQRDKDGCKVPQVKHPAVDFSTIEVEWKSLPPKLMYEILNFPTLVQDAKSYISFVTDIEAGPPDYEEYFESSAIKFSELGLKAIEISRQLREIGQLPEAIEQEEGWSRKEILSKAKVENLEIVEKRNSRQQQLMEELGKAI
jgi:hypothetical protein